MKQLAATPTSDSSVQSIGTLGKYRLIASLGQGGMAKVYLAVVAGLAGFNKLVVVKLLNQELTASSDDNVQMFLDEARLSARLVHPNIVHTYEVDEVDGRYILAMEYLEGQTYRVLGMRASKTTEIPIQDELRIISEAARGLHHAHELTGYGGEPLGVVHRDVSPQNVFVTYDGQVKVLDFGIAKVSDSDHLTQVGVIKGKLDYIAPEQLRGERIDRRADVFALGVMLWEAITGKRFGGGRHVADVAKVHARLAGSEQNVRVAKPEVPGALAAIVERALALDPNARFPDAASFADALDAYLESSGLKPSAKSLAALISPLFADDRQRISKLIEAQINAVKNEATISSRLKLSSDLTSLNAHSGVVPSVYIGTPEEQSVSANRSLLPLTAQRTRTKILVTIAAGLGMTCLTAAGLLLRSKTEPITSMLAPGIAETGAPATAPRITDIPRDAPTETQAQEPGVSAPAQPATPGHPAVHIELKVSPVGAQVLLDGAPIEVPFTGELRRDGMLHHLDVMADGYRPIRRLLAFNRDHSLEIELERAPTPPRRTSSTARPTEVARQQAPSAAPLATHEAAASAPAPTTPAQAPASDMAVVRRRLNPGNLDSNNPYAR